jgi:arabinofuranosyltransferase
MAGNVHAIMVLPTYIRGCMHFEMIAIGLSATVLPVSLLRMKVEKAREIVPSLRVRAFAVALIVPILCYCMGYSRIDDSFIYARYVANALMGRGMVFNAGEHVNALTSPLFAYLLLLVSMVFHGKVLLATSILSGIFLFLACLLAEKLVPFSGLLIASTAYFYILLGMETSLFVLMLLVTVALFQAKKYDLLPLAFVLLVLTRFEGGLLVATISWQMWKRRVWPKPVAFVPAVLVAGGYLFLNLHYYGAYLPSSATAKLGQGFSGYWGRWPTAFLGHTVAVEELFEKIPYFVPLLVGFSIAGVISRRKDGFHAVVFPFCVLLLMFYVGMNMTGLYFWYFAPFIVFSVMYAASAIPRTWAGAGLVSAFILLVAFTNAKFLARHEEEARYTGYVEAGKWLAQNTRGDARIEAVEIGLIGWYSDRYLFDVIGLTTPKNAAHIARHDEKSWLAEDNPDYIVMHEGTLVWEQVAKQSQDYVRETEDFAGGIYILRRKNYPYSPRVAALTTER